MEGTRACLTRWGASHFDAMPVWRATGRVFSVWRVSVWNADVYLNRFVDVGYGSEFLPVWMGVVATWANSRVVSGG